MHLVLVGDVDSAEWRGPAPGRRAYMSRPGAFAPWNVVGGVSPDVCPRLRAWVLRRLEISHSELGPPDSGGVICGAARAPLTDFPCGQRAGGPAF